MEKVLIEENVCLKNHNTLGLGGNCKKFFSPNNKEELIKFLKTNTEQYFIIGGGSNLILPDEDYNGVVISLKKLRKIKITGNTATIDAGITLSFMNNSLLKKGYTNFVWSAGIPGTLGGALFINAGCYGHDMYENLISVTVLKDGKVKTINKKNIKYSYRKTDFNEEIILSADFLLEKGDSIKAIGNMRDWAEKRIASQPLEYKNAGSTFKNPEIASAGALIDQAGLKGYKVGGASVSHKHANFIINDGTASSSDVKKLIKHIQKEVKRVHDVDLEIENILVNWE